MWLLDVDTFELTFFTAPPAKYAILSHTWGDDEVVFQDMKDLDKARNKNGWPKIRYACHQAKVDGLPYAWVDSCCIDKSSSAELSEAINSMFAWYRKAELCYAFLDDFERPDSISPTQGLSAEDIEKQDRSLEDAMASCRWFTRGWTLQELIAPQEVVFFNRLWEYFGTKDSLRSILAAITAIDEQVLAVMESMFALPVGRRMSWAAERRTTRIEDQAYCLLGIFDVNMPLLYGEGEKAFMRLQEEISRQHQDLSLYAWRQEGRVPEYRGIYAQSPSEFYHCSTHVSRRNMFMKDTEFTVSDRGLSFHVDKALLASENGICVNLDVMETYSRDGTGKMKPHRLEIYLFRFGDCYVRACPDQVVTGHTPLRPADGGKMWRDTETVPISVIKTLPRSHSNFISLTTRRMLVLLYRKDLSDVMWTAPQELGDGRDSYELPSVELENIASQNQMESSMFGLTQMFKMGANVVRPIWWHSFVLTYDSPSGGPAPTYSFAIVCGMPMLPDAPSERLVPWFALFCDRDAEDDFSSQLALLLNDHPRTDASFEMTGRVGDVIFEHFADETGYISQEKLPTSFIMDTGTLVRRELRLELVSGGPSTFCADVRYICLH